MRVLARYGPVALGAVMLSLVWGAGRASNPGPIGFRLDDAWIHMVYGRGLLANGYLAYEDGIASTGCTSPAWATALAGAHALFDHGETSSRLVAAVILLGAALHLGTILAAASLARRLSRSAAVGAIAGGLVALATPLAAASLSGMEVALTSLLLVLGIRAAVSGAAMRAGILLAAAGLARPEAGATILVVAAAVAGLAAPGRRRSTLGAVLLPPVLAGAALVLYDLWASGAPLPATFYAKSSASFVDLPRRVGVALGGILSGVPPFGLAIGWIAAAGLSLPRRATSSDSLARLLPFAAGAAFLLANLAVLDPIDPAAFYHQRYVFPPVPLFLVAAALGAQAWRERLPRWRSAPLVALGAASLLQSAASVAPVSRHLHNDVRNINEVQRRIGEFLHATLPPSTRIAASDAGAIRYFSRLPTLDVIGMNTPAMREPTDEFLRSHPVAALAILPAWFRTPDAANLEEVFRATTSNYTVTSNPAMATQVVVRARAEAGPGPFRTRFAGFRSFTLDFATAGAFP